jgi:hypothetical protein
VVSIPQQLDAESSANLRDIEQALLGATVSVPVFFTRDTPELQAAVSCPADSLYASLLVLLASQCDLFLSVCIGSSQGRLKRAPLGVDAEEVYTRLLLVMP